MLRNFLSIICMTGLNNTFSTALNFKKPFIVLSTFLSCHVKLTGINIFNFSGKGIFFLFSLKSMI